MKTYEGQAESGTPLAAPSKLSVADLAIAILRATRDGGNLDPEDLALVEAGVNGHLNALGLAALVSLHANASKPEGYTAQSV